MHHKHVKEAEPLTAPHGETVFETIGAAAGGTSTYSLAQIEIPPGKASLKHYHPQAEEAYHILSGSGQIEVDGEQRSLIPGESVAILPNQTHQIINAGEEPLVFLAVCVPAWKPDISVFVD